MTIKITTDRFYLRELNEHDVTEDYLNWFNEEEIKKYIYFASQKKMISDLKQYVINRSGRDDILFLGIFDKSNDLHIGNIKFEPVNIESGYTIMGILIGNSHYRGKGTTEEVLQACATWLKDHRKITQILLGVDNNNLNAIKAYKKAGFVIADSPHIKNMIPDSITMIYYL